MGTGRLDDVALSYLQSSPFCLFDRWEIEGAFDSSDIGKRVTFTFDDGTTFTSEKIYRNEQGSIIVKYNVDDDNIMGTPTSFPAIYVKDTILYYYPGTAIYSVSVSSEFYVPPEKFLNNNGLEYLWGKIKSLVSLKADKSYVDNRTIDYIVEQSISGDITYRKWNSGFLEVEGNASISTTSSTQSTNGYYTEAVYINLPVTFKSCKSLVYGCSDSNYYATRYGSYSTQTNKLGLRFCATRAISAGSHSVSFRAIGTWK